MKAAIYLDKREPNNLLAYVDLEVVPRGLYEIDGVVYQYTSQPKFIIDEHRVDGHRLTRVELIVTKFVDSDLV